MLADTVGATSGKPTASRSAYSRAPLIQLTQPRPRYVNHLPQAPDFDPQHLLPAGRQAIFPPGIATFEFPLALTHEPAGQQAIQVRVQSARSQPVIPPRLPFDRLHDRISMQVRLRQREKNVKGSR